VWNKPRNIALVTVAGILFHLALRYLLHFSPIAWQVPLILVLIIGGIPLLVPLAQKLFAREFGSDHLAGISIIASVVLSEYLVAAIVILMLSGGTNRSSAFRSYEVLDGGPLRVTFEQAWAFTDFLRRFRTRVP